MTYESNLCVFNDSDYELQKYYGLNYDKKRVDIGCDNFNFIHRMNNLFDCPCCFNAVYFVHSDFIQWMKRIIALHLPQGE